MSCCKNIYLFLIIALVKVSIINGAICAAPATIGANDKYELCGTLTPGTVIVINGTLTTKIFSINLRPNQHNTGLHIAVRVSEHHIVFNSMTNDKYDKELQAKFPAGFDKDFNFVIVCGKNFYEISLNENHLVHFPYRKALSQMRFFENFNFDQKYTIQFPRENPCDHMDLGCRCKSLFLGSN